MTCTTQYGQPPQPAKSDFPEARTDGLMLLWDNAGNHWREATDVEVIHAGLQAATRIGLRIETGWGNANIATPVAGKWDRATPENIQAAIDAKGTP